MTEELKRDIEILEEKLKEKRKQLAETIEEVDVYLHGDYMWEEYRDEYPNLTDEQIDELEGACEEVHLKYNLKTGQFTVVDD